MGLVESLGEFYPEAKWQRCIVHFYRNVLSVVPTKRMLEIATMLKAIHASEDRSAAIEKAEAVSVKLEGLKLREAARKIRQSIVETFTYYEFPREHRIRIRTNNALERIMREIRRRTRVVGAFPDGHSALMLCAARLRHVAGTQWGAKRYLNLDLLREQDLDKALELAEAM
jgi:transposase-like protein